MSTSQTPISCAVCHKDSTETQLQQCSRCKKKNYCGPECQRSDWPNHKSSCGPAKVCEDTGWGACALDECEDLKTKFETEFGGNEEKFYKYWPQGFRWTCCGTDADMKFGCDHHGGGSTPCTCDFCRMGKELPDRVYFAQSAPRMGLNLRRGPDPRSFNRGHAATAATMRATLGLDM